MVDQLNGGKHEPVPLVEVRNITKRFGPVTALEGVSFAVGEREIVGMLGDNGAGKSTMVKILSGVQQSNEGTVHWSGTAVSLSDRSAAHHLGIETIFQDSALVDSMSVMRNIFLGREIHGRLGGMRMREMRKITKSVLETIITVEGIDSPDKMVGSLSGGQKQAVAIARAVHFKRRLLILDEPTAALAVRATEALFDYVRLVRDQGVSSILVTHNLFDAYRICDRFVVLAHGHKIFDAPKETLTLPELSELVSRSVVAEPSGGGGAK